MRVCQVYSRQKQGQVQGHSDQVKPGFIAILKQMSPDEAELLNLLYTHASSKVGEAEVLERVFGEFVAKKSNRYRNTFTAGLDALAAAQLVRLSPLTGTVNDMFHLPPELFPGIYASLLTFRGREFVQACRPPKPRVNG
jgi:hypothetical protein